MLYTYMREFHKICLGCDDEHSEESPIYLGLSLMELVLLILRRIFRGFEGGVSDFVPSYMSGLFQFRLANPTNIANANPAPHPTNITN